MACSAHHVKKLGLDLKMQKFGRIIVLVTALPIVLTGQSKRSSYEIKNLPILRI